ncbi:MAG: hypothetical protein H8E26_11005 [FCB group bacterium]|nr:hypothetical protein [FCB group bacterium]MBL7026894.1 hypothetical protein [Candidatus Neomarinimicrobiota bacterium]MBL7121471.1 hypothetical protein [Candidatus Neomarinimicrobiota bacterium]
MRALIRNQNGFVVFVSMIMVMISLGFTVGYLHFVMGERILFMQRFAETRARYNAFTAISSEIGPLLKGPLFNTATDTTLDDGEIPEMIGGYRDVYGDLVENAETHRSQRHGRATGWSSYNSFANEPIEVEFTMEVNYKARGFEEFMYLTNEEAPGGGPWLGATVTFGDNEQLEGLVYSNDDITMSNYGCPEFINLMDGEEIVELSEVYTAGDFVYGPSCDDDVFAGVFEDSMPKIEWPPYEGQDQVRGQADYIYYGNSGINITDLTQKDSLIMTRLIFKGSQIQVLQWKYVIPPFVEPTPPASMVAFDKELKMYHPQYYKDTYGMGELFFRGELELQHYDFPPPSNPNMYVTNETLTVPEAVIWIEGGQVQLMTDTELDIRGRYTIATSGPVQYKMHHDSTKIAELNCNIWIMNDLLFADSDQSTGYVVAGSPNRLGLLSGGNIIVANTTANGARNGGGGANAHVKINAAMIAMNESFIIQYWQNSTQFYNFLGPTGGVMGDGRGVLPFRPHTGTNDIRGTVMIFGSVVQDKRGYLKRNNPGPYPITQGIGYEKDYHYDRNLRDFPPPEWPETKNSDGSSSLELSGIGEYIGE